MFQVSTSIFAGLVLSAIGDAFLVHPDYQIFGIASFGVAHIFYIWAFGFKVINIPIGIALYIAYTAIMFLTIPSIPEPDRNAIHQLA